MRYVKNESKKRKESPYATNKNNTSAAARSADQCDVCACLIDLPNVQSFVFVNGFVHLVWLESFGRAAIHNFRNSRWCAFAVLIHHLMNQIVDLIGGRMLAKWR